MNSAPSETSEASSLQQKLPHLALSALFSLVFLVFAYSRFTGKSAHPFIQLYLAGMGLIGANLLLTRGRFARGPQFSLFMLLLSLLATELAFLASADHSGGRQVRVHPLSRNNSFVLRRQLGFPSPAPNSRFQIIAATKDRKLYDEVAHFNRLGHRVTRYQSAGPAYVFMGCSYAFGHGVQDSQSIPQRFSDALDGRHQVVNLAFSGWGPHHMLRLIEKGEIKRALGSNDAAAVIYIASDHHIQRCTGRASWDPAGPFYALNEQGQLKPQGPFLSARMDRFRRATSRSAFGHFLWQRLYYQRPPTHSELRLYAELVKRAASLVEANSKTKFYVFCWWDEGPAPWVRCLEQRGLRVLRMSQLIPKARWAELVFSKGVDQHPNPKGCKVAAQALVKALKLKPGKAQ